MSSPIVLYRPIFYKFRLVLVSHCTGLNLSVVFKYLFFNCHIFKYILHSCQRNSWWNCHLPSTHYLPFVKLSTAVGCGHDGTAHLQVPGLVSILCGAGDGYSVDTAGVTITWTVITLLTTVSGCPNKNGSQAFAPLCDIKKKEVNHFKRILLREVLCCLFDWSNLLDALLKSLLSKWPWAIHCLSIIFWAPAGTVDVNVVRSDSQGLRLDYISHITIQHSNACVQGNIKDSTSHFL